MIPSYVSFVGFPVLFDGQRVGNPKETVIHLIQSNRLDPDAHTIRELFLKHGTKELYEKVQRACRGD